ncbi:hypothetical protein ACKF11_13555 [Methylobacillus sp. Pita2]|uniref:hypothetical protein n=1 Tax=Methylobacillus sp. Pita2 TaxID=3383245 RepID=UPI0038B653FD
MALNEQEIRERFENWYFGELSPSDRSRTKTSNGYYKHAGAHNAWGIWQAAIANVKDIFTDQSPVVMQAPEGWRFAPIEPTKEQLLASRRYKAKNKIATGPGFYRAMLAVAPQPISQACDVISANEVVHTCQYNPSSTDELVKAARALYVVTAGIRPDIDAIERNALGQALSKVMKAQGDEYTQAQQRPSFPMPPGEEQS